MRFVGPQMPNGGVFDVKAYGAKGDGSTDDATAIGACLTAAGTYAASNGGATVVFPPARYKWGSLKEVPSDVTIYAYGAFIFGVSTAGFIKNYGSTPAAGYTTGNQRITVLGGTWDGKGQSAATDTTYSLFYFRNARAMTVRDATFRNAAGLPAVHLLAVDGATVQNSRFEGYVDNTTGGSGNSGKGDAVQLDQDGSGNPAKNVSMMQCHVGAAIDGSALGSFRTGIGSHADTASSWYTGIRVIGNHFDDTVNDSIFGLSWQDCIISGNTMNSPGWEGIKMSMTNNTAAARIIVTSNVVVDSTFKGIMFDPTGSNRFSSCVVGKNVVDNAGGQGIDLIRTDSSNACGNTVSNGTDVGIFVSGCNDTLVGGNNVWQPDLNGIGVDGCARCQIVGNRVYDTGRDGITLTGGTTRTAVTGNFVVGASRATDATYYPLRTDGNASGDDNVFIGNRVQRTGSSGNSASVAFRKDAGTSQTGTTVVFNTFEGWSATHSSNVSVADGTVDYSIAGTSTANNCQA